MSAVKRGRGRPIGTRQTEITRERIRAGMLIGRLMRHVRGECEMSPTQVRAAEILLRKTLPDLSAVDHTGAIEHHHVADLSDNELLAIASGRSAGTAATESGAEEPAPVH